VEKIHNEELHDLQLLLQIITKVIKSRKMRLVSHVDVKNA
jgi:hypothetical protein